MVGGVYSKRKFERDGENARPEVITEKILVQLGAGGSTHYIGKPEYDITLVKVGVFASVNAATTTTTAAITLTLKEASAGGATTATVTGGAFSASTTAGSGVEEFSTVCTAAIPATVGLYLVAGATTLIDDNAVGFIQYTIDSILD